MAEAAFGSRALILDLSDIETSPVFKNLGNQSRDALA